MLCRWSFGAGDQESSSIRASRSAHKPNGIMEPLHFMLQLPWIAAVIVEWNSTWRSSPRTEKKIYILNTLNQTVILSAC
eukprot:scaffold268193_cov21-Prasinocladus_malaysianus.AAC.2